MHNLCSISYKIFFSKDYIEKKLKDFARFLWKNIPGQIALFFEICLRYVLLVILNKCLHCHIHIKSTDKKIQRFEITKFECYHIFLRYRRNNLMLSFIYNIHIRLFNVSPLASHFDLPIYIILFLIISINIRFKTVLFGYFTLS